MTPAARVQAAIEIFDRIEDGTAAEKALTGWARRSRFAGSKDRAAIRDHVFDALRCKRSFGWLGNGTSGRAVMIGACRAEGIDPSTVFHGVGHAPAPLNADELAEPKELEAADEAVQYDVPDWLWADLSGSLGNQAQDVASILRRRAPAYLRANLLKTTRDALRERLRTESIETTVVPLSDTALEAVGSPRGLTALPSFADGWFEMQDVASQAVVDRLVPYLKGANVLDYCAGGGGKALAMAAYDPVRIGAHDSNASRMTDLPARAHRAGADIEIAEAVTGRFDLVVCDAPCSGSGAWRRQPAAKWELTQERLTELRDIQAEILRIASGHVRSGGHLAYATCSLLDLENDEQVARFLSENQGWSLADRMSLTPLDGGDGFFLAVLKAPQTS